MQTATVVMGLAAWWGTACRVGQMDPGQHRLLVRMWHWMAGVIALACVGWAAVLGGDVLTLGTVASLIAYLAVTLHEWAGGPPAWALQPQKINAQRKA